MVSITWALVSADLLRSSWAETPIRRKVSAERTARDPPTFSFSFSFSFFAIPIPLVPFRRAYSQPSIRE
jgi:hypothetical protein